MKRKFLTEEQAIELYNETLNEQEIKTGNMSYLPSYILEKVDPIAYNVGMNEFFDYLSQEGYIIENYNDDE